MGVFAGLLALGALGADALATRDLAAFAGERRREFDAAIGIGPGFFALGALGTDAFTLPRRAAFAVDHEGEVLEVFATKRRDRRAALKFLKRAMKRYGRPRLIVTALAEWRQLAA